MTLAWPNDAQPARCPLCALDTPHDVAVEASTPAGTVRYLRCARCGTVFAPASPVPSYESQGPLDETVQYYVEQLAAINTIVDPLFTLDPRAIRHYAEVGCSFGFALDFGSRAFGWAVRGVDPSALAAAGSATLGLPIEARLLTEDAPLSPPADLLIGSEVVEHVPDPHAFMRALAASLSPAGVLVLSTPNAAAVRPGTAHTVLMALLCPGYHLMLLTAAGLLRLVEAHGFLHHHVRETPVGLTVFASRQSFAWAADGHTDRATYVRYLHARLAAAPPGSPMECGMLYRLLREHAIFAQWTEAEALVPRVQAAYAARGVDLSDPAACRPDAPPGTSFIEYVRRHPTNVGGVFFALGLAAMLHRRDSPAALALFDAAAAWLAAIRQVLETFSTTDAESDEFERLAVQYAMALAIRQDPVAALARLPALPMDAVDANGAPFDALLFIELVNAGRHQEAAQVHGAAASAGPRCNDVLDARRMLALGIHALNGVGDRDAARLWLGRALARAAGDDPVMADLCRAAAAALEVAGPVPAMPVAAMPVPAALVAVAPVAVAPVAVASRDLASWLVRLRRMVPRQRSR